ncbi:hypothetical protein CYMTET_29101 [Cymbomonas tetramitiformis]|uniref:Uncharacterized protein n=1 Tax=Cymbomonas tetramitiformis TaxID=36881 RepID=A0AAE0KVJ2_9CHLO|nr:hypothetical protein CYMTET_29101 [Cymbomonas tetramitiformis]
MLPVLYTCKEAFGSGRVPDTALPAGKRPPPPAFAAALASFQTPDCPAASPPVVPAQQADTPCFGRGGHDLHRAYVRRVATAHPLISIYGWRAGGTSRGATT